MATEKNLREELLKQNSIGRQPGGELRDKVLARDQVRVARMRRLTIYTWILVGAGPVVAAVFGLLFPDVLDPVLLPGLIVIWRALLLIAVIFTISWYVRWGTLTLRQIQSSLALIEEHLKKMSQKD